jgi:hypothetical protein
MRCLPRVVFAICVPLALAGVTKAPAAPHARKPAVKGKPKPRAVTHTSARGNVPGRQVKGNRGRPPLHKTPVERSQAAPTPERYREIQQALVAKGYLKSEPTGAWDADTQDAMRRFQADQKLDETGKINALSLISLGLGPQH